MNLPLFTDSEHCRSRKKCHICRNRGRIGFNFRQTLSTVMEMPGPGLFACPHGITEATADKPPPPIVPSPEQQREWTTAAMAWCKSCPAFGGVSDHPADKLIQRIACADCKTCGSKTISAVQDCPRGHFVRLRVSPTE